MDKEKITKAAKQILEGRITLCQQRLEAINGNLDEQGILNMLRQPIEATEDNNINSGSGTCCPKEVKDPPIVLA